MEPHHVSSLILGLHASHWGFAAITNNILGPFPSSLQPPFLPPYLSFPHKNSKPKKVIRLSFSNKELLSTKKLLLLLAPANMPPTLSSGALFNSLCLVKTYINNAFPQLRASNIMWIESHVISCTWKSFPTQSGSNQFLNLVRNMETHLVLEMPCRLSLPLKAFHIHINWRLQKIFRLTTLKNKSNSFF